MQMYGPVPSEELLIELSVPKNEAVRRRAAMQLGLSPYTSRRRAVCRTMLAVW